MSSRAFVSSSRAPRLASLPRRVGILVCLILALFTLVGGAVDAGATTGPTVITTPSTGLGNGQFVKITWSGFAPYALAYFRQCIATPVDISVDCTAKYQVSPPSSADGTGTIYLPVFRGTIQSETAGTTFECTVDAPCVMAVLGNPTDLSTAGYGTLDFAASADACPDEGDATVLGGGASAPGTAMERWAGTVCQPPQSLPVAYSMSDSPNGRLQFAAGNYDFAATSTPFPLDEQKQLYKDGKGYAYAPVTSSGLVLAYRMFERGTLGDQGPQIFDLRLTPSDVARIFTGQVQNWGQDKHINAINPAHAGKLPIIVQPLVRGDHSAATWEFTQWLTETARSSLPKSWPGVTDTYPTGTYLPATNGAETADELALDIAAPSDNGIYFGFIGYIDSSLADYYGLPTVKIQNAAGKFVTATPESLRAADRHLKTNPDKATVTPDYLSKDPLAYPLPTISYVAGPTNNEDSTKAGVIANFIRWAATDGQAPHVLPDGYIPLAPRMVAEANKAAAEIAAQTGKPVKPVNNTPKIKKPHHTCTTCHQPPPPSSPPPTTPPPTTPPPTTPPPTTPPATCPSASPSAGPSAGASPSASPSATRCPTHPTIDRVTFPSTTSDASRLLLPSLGCLALLGFAAGPGIQLATKKSRFMGLLRRLMRKGIE
jgi:ABC-type phosphate transport system substrate-binding protein